MLTLNNSCSRVNKVAAGVFRYVASTPAPPPYLGHKNSRRCPAYAEAMRRDLTLPAPRI